MNYPKISIVTPSYNQAEFLEETICSVLDQGYPNLQYVIVDGGSQDGSVDIIKKYEKYLWWWISEPDRGHGNALNKGFAKTTGEIMAWLNSDDKYKAGTFKAVSEIFNKYNDVNWIVGKNGWWNKSGEFVNEKFVYKNIYDFLLGDYAWIQQESTFWRRGLWDAAGGYINEHYKFMVDGELWTRFFMLDDLWHINQVFGGYRTHDTNRAQLHINEVKGEMEQAIKVLIDKLAVNERIMRVIKILQDPQRLYTEEVSLHYSVIDYIDSHWEKKMINYFAVKAKDSFANFLQIGNYEQHPDTTLLRILNKRIIIWGTGSKASECYEMLQMNGLNNLVFGFVDNNKAKWDSFFCDIPVYSPTALKKLDNDYVIIIGSMYYREIGKQIEKLGLMKLNNSLYSTISYVHVNIGE